MPAVRFTVPSYWGFYGRDVQKNPGSGWLPAPVLQPENAGTFSFRSGSEGPRHPGGAGMGPWTEIGVLQVKPVSAPVTKGIFPFVNH